MKNEKTILLIDDDESTNRYHEIIIKQLDNDILVHKAKNGRIALDFLESDKVADYPKLIFLDLNMPVMDGFRFVELYQKSASFRQHEKKIIVLTTSLIPEEKKKMLENNNIKEFLNKPLNKNMLKEILEEIF